MKRLTTLFVLLALVMGLGLAQPATAAGEFTISKLSVFDLGIGEGAAEIAAYHRGTRQVYITNGAKNRVDIVAISDPSSPVLVDSVDMTPFGDSVNSVAAGKSVIAVAVHRSATFAPDGTPTLRNGNLVILQPNGKFIRTIDLGAVQPDSVSFTPDGLTALVAMEGEPICAKDNTATPANEAKDYALAKDPRGAVAIVNLRKPASAQAKLVTFDGLSAESLRASGLVVSLTSKDPSVDIEPECVSASTNTKAFASLQEANGLAEIDITKGKLVRVFSAGVTDMSKVAYDLSDRDSGSGPATYNNVYGLAMPDAVAAYSVGKDNYIVTANEGDDRADWSCFTAVDDKRAKDMKVDTSAIPDWDAIKVDAKLGRAKVNPNIGDANGDGLYERLYLLSNRSFSIFKNGKRIYDSENLLEQLQISALGVANINGEWNLSTGAYGAQSRSDDKGPEAEGVTVGMVGSKRVAVIGMERMSALLFVDITNPAKPTVIKWEQMMPLTGVTPKATGLAWSPEGLAFVSAKDSPTGKALVLTSYEVSGTLSIHQIEN